MARSQHERAVRQAARTSAELKTLFGRLGNAEHPRGRILSAYRMARRALKGNLGSHFAVQDTLFELRNTAEMEIWMILRDAAASGREQAESELGIYGLPVHGAWPDDRAALTASLLILDQQIAAINALLATGDASENIILGDASRVGILSPAPVIREANKWTTEVALLAWWNSIKRGVEQAGAQDDYVRQAIAAIDHLTTDCCLRVHGQTAELDGDFTLTGTPRFADKQYKPPFHWNCRTAEALVLRSEADDSLTARMRKASRDELRFRDEAQSHIDRLKKELADDGQFQDIRIRQADDAATKRKRNAIRMWQERLEEEIWPSFAMSGRGK